METETGEEAAVTPSELWEKLKEFFPKLLFLSGCQTGKSGDVKGKESFAYQMVQFGVPVVLSWGLSVGDKGATLLASRLYEELAKGIPLEQAIFWARKAVEKTYNPWPLLRIFTDQSAPDKPIINKRGVPGKHWGRIRKRSSFITKPWRYLCIFSGRITPNTKIVAGNIQSLKKKAAVIRSY